MMVDKPKSHKSDEDKLTHSAEGHSPSTKTKKGSVSKDKTKSESRSSRKEESASKVKKQDLSDSGREKTRRSKSSKEKSDTKKDRLINKKPESSPRPRRDSKASTESPRVGADESVENDEMHKKHKKKLKVELKNSSEIEKGDSEANEIPDLKIEEAASAEVSQVGEDAAPKITEDALGSVEKKIRESGEDHLVNVPTVSMERIRKPGRDKVTRVFSNQEINLKTSGGTRERKVPRASSLRVCSPSDSPSNSLHMPQTASKGSRKSSPERSSGDFSNITEIESLEKELLEAEKEIEKLKGLLEKKDQSLISLEVQIYYFV